MFTSGDDWSVVAGAGDDTAVEDASEDDPATTSGVAPAEGAFNSVLN